MSQRGSDRLYLALAWMACSAIGFSSMSVFVKRLGTQIPQFELVFFRSLINLILVFLIMRMRGECFVAERSMRRILIYRGFAGLGGISCLFYAITHLPLPIASMLSWSSPLFVILFSRVFLKEKIAARSAVCVAVAFLGLLLLVRPQSGLDWSSIPFRAFGIGLFGAALAGSAYVAVRAATAKVGVNLIVFYFMAVATAISFPLALLDFKLPSPVQSFEILLLGTAAMVGQLTMTRGYHYAQAGKVSAMSLLNAAFSAFFGWAIFDERLSWMQWIGILVMAAAIAALTWGGKPSEQGATRAELRYE